MESMIRGKKEQKKCIEILFKLINLWNKLFRHSNFESTKKITRKCEVLFKAENVEY